MRFQFGNYELEIDVATTRAIYQKLGFVSEGCTCDGCRNFWEAVVLASKQVVSFFNLIGVDIQKPREVYVNISEDDGQRLFYGGFYRLCGKVIDGNSAWTPCGDMTTFSWDKSKTYEIMPGFNVSFQSQCVSLEDEFSMPAIQMEIEFHIPWVLEKENVY